MDVKSAQFALESVLKALGITRNVMEMDVPLRAQLRLSAVTSELLEAKDLLEYALGGEVKCAKLNLEVGDLSLRAAHCRKPSIR